MTAKHLDLWSYKKGVACLQLLFSHEIIAENLVLFCGGGVILTSFSSCFAQYIVTYVQVVITFNRMYAVLYA